MIDMKHEITDTQLRELDAWIAEHVMKWRWWRFNYPGKQGGCGKWQQLVPPYEKWPTTYKKWNGKQSESKHPSLEDCTEYKVFKPTTDAACAMAVLEKCADKRTVAMNCDKDGNWCVAFIKPAVLGACCVDGAVEAETLPLAIAMFAKKHLSLK